MSRIMEIQHTGYPQTNVGSRVRIRIWGGALAAAAVVLLAILWQRNWFGPEKNPPRPTSAFTLLSQAWAAEQTIFAGDKLVQIVNEIIVQPVSDAALAKVRWLPVVSLEATGKTRFHQLTLPAEPGETYTVDDQAWYDPGTGRFVRLFSVGARPIFANSFDGEAVYGLEPGPDGRLQVAGKPITQDFHRPKSAAEFLGIAAGLQNRIDESDADRVSDAGSATLADGSAVRLLKLGFGAGGPDAAAETYWIFKIRSDNNTIAEMEWVANGESLLVVRRVRTETVDKPGVGWNLAGIEPRFAQSQESPKVGITPDMVVPDVSVERMVDKADFETYIFASDPPWATAGRQITDILDIVSPLHRMFAVSYRAGDGRHVVLMQSHSYNKMLGPMSKMGKLVYTSPRGVKVWSGPKDKWLAGILLKSAQYAIKDRPSDDRTGYLLETPAGTFPTVAVNGSMSEEELHGLIDSLVPAREYLGR